MRVGQNQEYKNENSRRNAVDQSSYAAPQTALEHSALHPKLSSDPTGQSHGMDLAQNATEPKAAPNRGNPDLKKSFLRG